MINDYPHIYTMSELSKMTETIFHIKTVNGNLEDIPSAFKNKPNKVYLESDLLHFVTRFGITPSTDNLGSFVTPEHFIELSKELLETMDSLYFGVLYTTKNGEFNGL